jgi:hypothetical protein
MFECMGADNWTDVHRYAMALLRAVVAWNPDWNSTRWQVMCPHVARLTRIMQAVYELDGPGARPADPDRLVELLAAAVAAAAVCEQHATGDGPEHGVKTAAGRLSAVLGRLGTETTSVTRRQLAHVR